MNTIDHLQGTAAWHAHRASHFNASDAPAMMGLSPHKTRSELLREMATGITPEIDQATQLRFNDGHRFEELARPLAEKILGESLFPVVGYEGKLSASFDGLTMDESACFEHKTINAAYREAIATGSTLPAALLVQIEQQLMLADATRCLFMASKWTPEDTLVDEVHCWVDSDPKIRAALIAGWAQFAEDLANYVHVEREAAPVAAPIKDLPAIIITATGSLSVETNFKQWEIELRDFIARIPEKPSTDQEFANCKAAVGAFKAAEAALDAEEARVLTMVPSVDDMRRHKKLLRDLSSTTRLALEKLVVRRDIDVKNEIITGARTKYEEHTKALNARLGGQYMPHINPSFSEAMKSKRSYATMRDAVGTALAQAKIEASAIADTIEANRLEMTGELDWSFLFPDFAAVCTKARDDFNSLLMARIAKHNEAQAAKDAANKAAEDARIAAAVEAERLAGEVRAAAEAVRIRKEETDKLAKQVEEDRRGKTSDATHAVQQATELPQAPAAITPPTPDHIADAGKVIHEDEAIDDFIALLPMTDTEKRAHRLTIIKWEKYRVALLMKAAA